MTFLSDMNDTKRCTCCEQEKPISEFYKGFSKCKSCVKAAVKTRRDEHPELDLDTRLKTCKKRPTHKNAYMAVDAALRCGVLIRPHYCSGCGCSDSEHRIEAHHYDHSKPLDVIWLCTPCHEKMDAERRIRLGKPNHSASKSVLMMRDGEVLCRFPSASDAARAVGRAPNSISQCATGVHKTCAGFQWVYEDIE